MLRAHWRTAAAAAVLLLASASAAKAQDLRVLIIPPAPVKDPLMGNIVNWSAFENAWVLASPADLPYRMHVPAFIGKRIKGDDCSECSHGKCGKCKKRRGNNCCCKGQNCRTKGCPTNCCTTNGCATKGCPTKVCAAKGGSTGVARPGGQASVRIVPTEAVPTEASPTEAAPAETHILTKAALAGDANLDSPAAESEYEPRRVPLRQSKPITVSRLKTLRR